MHDWIYFEYMVMKNMKICDLNSSTHDLINIFLNMGNDVSEWFRVNVGLRRLCDISMVI